MLDLDDRLDELKQLGLYRRTRMVSGPQGPRVVLDGRPVLVLCSGNSLGLADHPRVREAAADAAMRWGVGAGASRAGSGTMTLHRRLEERLARFLRSDAGVVFGSGSLANMGVIPALARKGEVVFHDELAHASIADGCRLAGADASPTATPIPSTSPGVCASPTAGRADRDRRRVRARRRRGAPGGHRRARAPLRRARAGGRGAGDRRARSGGRGAVAEAGLEDEIDVITGSFGKALGSYGGFAACDHVTARFLVHSARPLLHSTAPRRSPSRPRWRRWSCSRSSRAGSRSCSTTPRRCATSSPARASRSPAPPRTWSRSSSARPRPPPDRRVRARAGRLLRGRRRPPPRRAARLRLAVMASHTRAELRGAASVIARAALRAGLRPGAGRPVAAAQNLAKAA